MIDPEDARRRHALVGPADLWERKRDFQISFLRRMGLKPEHYFLDLGCGTLRGGIPVIALLEEGHYFGIDSRAEVLVEARQELCDHALEQKRPTLLHSPDLAQVSIDRKFDLVWAFSVLIHFTDEVLRDALSLVQRQLAPHGVFYANVNIGEIDSSTGWREFPVVQRPLQFYRDIGSEYGLTVEDIGALADYGHGADMTGGYPTDRRFLKLALK